MAIDGTRSPYFRFYNANPWNRRIPDCAVRSVSLATGIPYVDVCKALGVSFKNGHGLIRNVGFALDKISETFADRFDVVVDFEEELDPEDIPGLGPDTAAMFDDEFDDLSSNSEMNLGEWMELNRGSGKFVVGLHTPSNGAKGHLVYVDTDAMRFYDTWDSSQWKVDAWLRVKNPPRRIAP